MKSKYTERKILIYLFFIGLLFFLLSSFGIFNGISAKVSALLYNSLGYTNRWSKSYGPAWFVGMINDISSLGSRELVLIFSAFIYFYLSITKGRSEARKYIFTVGLGIVLILTIKSITSSHTEITFNTILTESLSNFPSGHTFIATVMYLAITKYFSSSRNSRLANKYLYVSASIIIALVGISRFVGAGHTVTEVIAGWSLGLCWYTFAQIFLSLNKNSFAKS